MKRIQTIIAVTVVLAALAIGTYYQGLYSERWGRNDSDLILAMTSCIENTPLQFGQWRGEVTQVTKQMERQYQRAHLLGHIEIQFEHAVTGKTVQVSLVCGPRRHIGVSPIVRHCGYNPGFRMSSDPVQEHVTWDGGRATIMGTEFLQDTDDGEEKLKIVWCWGADKKWIAPEPNIISRIGLTSSPAWYKLYIGAPVPDNLRYEDFTDNVDFLQEFMPLLNKVLFPPKKPESGFFSSWFE